MKKTKLGVVRPTTSKVLESLMGTLAAELDGARVLDLFAGTGTVGRAALEAGAREVLFVEGHSGLAGALRKSGVVVAGRLPDALERLEGPFDVILADPPYGCPEGPATLEALAFLLAPEGVAVFEHHHKDAYPDRSGGLRLDRRRRFGETALSYYRFETTPAAPG